jgi:hypothetical protein
MTLQSEHPEPVENIEISTGDSTRLVVSKSESVAGPGVGIVRQYLDQRGDWHLASRGGLLIHPDTARELAPALVAVAGTIDGGPPESAPTDEECEPSRMP